MVDDADHAADAVNRVFAEIGVEMFEVNEHEVDYDEAFVRVVQRHRSTSDGEPDDGADADRATEAEHDAADTANEQAEAGA